MRSEYLANLSLAQAQGHRVETRRKASRKYHQHTPWVINWYPLLGFFLAFLWFGLLPLVAYFKG